jgi:hypothetical protein
MVHIPKCGGVLSRLTSVVASFEDMAADCQLTDHVFARNTWGTMGSVNVFTAYCGRASMYFPRSLGTINQDWLRNRSSGKTQLPDNLLFSTAEFLYICMAYKIPPKSHVVLGMKVKF